MNSERVWALIRMGRHAEAAAAAREALTTEPDDLDLHVALTAALVETDPKEAVKAGRQAVSLRPNDVAALGELTRAYLAARKLKDARKSAETLVAHAPSVSFAHQLLGGALYGQAVANGMPHKATLERALAAATRARELAPHSADPFVLLGHIHSSLGDERAAKDSASAALRIDPDHSGARTLLGVIAEHQGEFHAAGEHYLAAGRADPGGGAADRLRGLGTAAPAIGLIAIIGIQVAIRASLRPSISDGDYRALVVGAAIVFFLVGGFRTWRRLQVERSISDEARAVRERDARFDAPDWRHRRWWFTGRRGELVRAALTLIALAGFGWIYTLVPHGSSDPPPEAITALRDDDGDIVALTDQQDEGLADLQQFLENNASTNGGSAMTLQVGDCLGQTLSAADANAPVIQVSPCDEPSYGRVVAAVDNPAACEAIVEVIIVASADAANYRSFASSGQRGTLPWCAVTSDTPADHGQWVVLSD